MIRVIDLVFVTKDAAGDVAGIELSDLDEATSAAFQPHVEEPSGMLAEEDIEDLGAELAPNSSAAILLFEHLWATQFRDAVVDSGGELVASIRIPKEAIDEVVARELTGPDHDHENEEREETPCFDEDDPSCGPRRSSAPPA